MHVCPDELIVLSSAPAIGLAIVKCITHAKVFFASLKRVRNRVAAPQCEGYSWMEWHPEFDEPGGG